jgi:hypothetical protein
VFSFFAGLWVAISFPHAFYEKFFYYSHFSPPKTLTRLKRDISLAPGESDQFFYPTDFSPKRTPVKKKISSVRNKNKIEDFFENKCT